MLNRVSMTVAMTALTLLLGAGAVGCSESSSPVKAARNTKPQPTPTPIQVTPPPPVTPSAKAPDVPARNTIRFDHGITVFVDVEDERLEAECVIISELSRALEYLVITDAGASHEALLRMSGRASDFKQGIELLGAREGKRKLRHRADPQAPDGDPLAVSVRTRNSAGEFVEVPLESWVTNDVSEEVMAPGPWTFTGSVTVRSPELPAPLLHADSVGNIVAIWRDPSCIIDNPRPSPTADNHWFPNPKAGIPGTGAKVTLIVRKHVVSNAETPTKEATE